jgi:hypothetical protein
MNMGYCVLVLCRYRDLRIADMENNSEGPAQCLLVSSKYPPHLRSVMSMLHAHGIHVEEGLHRPWGSDELVPALMVSIKDYPRASALADSVAPMLGVRAH